LTTETGIFINSNFLAKAISSYPYPLKFSSKPFILLKVFLFKTNAPPQDQQGLILLIPRFNFTGFTPGARLKYGFSSAFRFILRSGKISFPHKNG